MPLPLTLPLTERALLAGPLLPPSPPHEQIDHAGESEDRHTRPNANAYRGPGRERAAAAATETRRADSGGGANGGVSSSAGGGVGGGASDESEVGGVDCVDNVDCGFGRGRGIARREGWDGQTARDSANADDELGAEGGGVETAVVEEG